MIDDCWNKIGVRGDLSCTELTKHAHCRNCPVHASAAAAVLRNAPLGDGLDDRANHFAQPSAPEERSAASVVIFTVGDEWLALTTSVVDEVARPRAVHSLPHRRGGPVLGVTNVRGELLISVSLGSILGLQAAARAGHQPAEARSLVLQRDGVRIVCPVDAVHGMARYQPAALREVPSTLAKVQGRYSTKLLRWNDRSVGMIDDQLLFYTVKRSVA